MTVTASGEHIGGPARAAEERPEHLGRVLPFPSRGALAARGSGAAPAPAPSAPAAPVPATAARTLPAAIEALGDFVDRRLTGDYQVDEFGYDEDLTDHALLPVMRLFYDHWFRIEVRGLEHVPDTGRALVVSNHSGVIPFDALMLQVALRDHHPAARRLRLLAADLVFGVPVLSHLVRKAGHASASPDDARRLLEQDQLVGVFPEGFKGIGKPFNERYRLQRFGRGGFVATAVAAGAPIIPCSIVGAEEIYPKVGDLKALARLLKLPYFPVTPMFPWFGPAGLLPLPTKWIIEFGPAMDTGGFEPGAEHDPGFVYEVADEVRETIQRSLNRLVIERGDPF